MEIEKVHEHVFMDVRECEINAGCKKLTRNLYCALRPFKSGFYFKKYLISGK